MEENVGKSEKLIKRRRVKNERVRAENKWMIWHNKRVVILNSTLQFLDTYRSLKNHISSHMMEFTLRLTTIY